MTEPESVSWPEGWDLTMGSESPTVMVWVDIEQFRIWRSGGSTPEWYVDQCWAEDPDTSIVGPSATQAEAVEHLKTWLAGGYVPDGDEIVVRVGEKSTGYMPVFHNRRGEKYVAIPEVI
jgi:hypothetical protein